MAVQRIEGKHGVTLIADKFAEFGEFGGVASTPEKTREEWDAERLADRVAHAPAVLRQNDWTAEDFAEATAFHFPSPIGRQLSGPHDGEAIYSKKQIARWRARVLAFAARIR